MSLQEHLSCELADVFLSFMNEKVVLSEGKIVKKIDKIRDLMDFTA